MQEQQDNTVLNAILEQLKKNAMPDRLWSADDVATYMGLSKASVQQRIICKPDFPPAVRVPTTGKSKTDPRWEPSEVKKWVLQWRPTTQQKRKAGRPRAA